MARIRTIKPEFPQSESMGNVSRDARLTFLQLWTIADDEGRLRGNSRMLASLLFPYDDDAPALIDGWLAELEREGCIVRYQVGSQNYLQIANWLIHQKIDKPSKSKIPEFVPAPRVIANVREYSSEDQGSRIKDQGKDHISAPPVAVAPPVSEIEKPKRKAAIDLPTFLSTCKANNEKPIPDGSPVFVYAEEAGIPDDFLRLHWLEFKERYGSTDGNGRHKKYADWRKVFSNSVRGNWFTLWRASSEGGYVLTTQGVQAKNKHAAGGHA
ncbi:hypothetical protein [Massilia endophytica]|uniref:hypothetical protein n=1 Tax=Massilia endophytica TaxID=2899220 RepID=UPI001E43C361|nr:hypothetical protein [Massilia endophytica]UGQ44957.1 hypothetical protein LSQ66_14240 [Massilia endophytica]